MWLLQVKKPRHRKLKWTTQHHTACEWWGVGGESEEPGSRGHALNPWAVLTGRAWRGAGPESQGLSLVLEVMGSLTRVCSSREESHIWAGDGYFFANGRRSEWSGERNIHPQLRWIIFSTSRYVNFKKKASHHLFNGFHFLPSYTRESLVICNWTVTSSGCCSWPFADLTSVQVILSSH